MSDDDVKVGALLSGEAGPSELSPEVQAQLARWFDAPSLVEPHLADGSVPPDADVEAPDDGPAAERKKRGFDDIDPELHARLEVWETEGDNLAARIPPMQLLGDRGMSMAGTERWQFEDTTEERFTERPWDIPDHLAEVTPQAVLRDLHRPVTHYERVTERTPVALGVSYGLRVSILNRSTMGAEYRVDMREFQAPIAEMETELAAMRESLDQPWDQIELKKQSEEEQLSPAELAALHAKWFG